MERDRIDVVRGLHSADPDVIANLIELHQHRLFRYLLALAADHSVASDLFQETWVRVLERGSQYRGQWKFESWLFAVARHLFIDRLRRKDPASLDALVSPGDGEGFQPETGDISPLDRLISGEERERVSRSLALIPAVQREVLVLRFQILFPLFIGIIPAFFVLLIGYVNRDAGRRGMRRALWTLIVIFFPYAIGFILYFFMRKPLEVVCGRCGAVVSSRVNYCPRCANAINPTCSHCHAVIGAGDAFCANCGTDLRTAVSTGQEQLANQSE